MILVVWEGESLMHLYPYNYKDPLKEQVGRFLHYGLTQLLDQSQLLDLKVMVGGQMFRCHGLVMACISDFFKSELAELRRCPRKRQKGEKKQEEEEEEEEETTIVLDDSCVTPHIFQLLLDMIYQGSDVLQDPNLMDLMKAATYLKITSIEFRVLDLIVRQMGESSCLNIWEWAENNNVPKLASKAKGVALTYFQVLRHTEDFLHIPIERLTVMLDHELLKYRYEDEILESILDWVEYARADRQQHLKELLPFVCFPFLSTRYLNELRKNDLIGLRSEYGSYLDEALTYHLASLQTGGKAIQKEILQRQILSLKRLMPGMRMVVVLIGGTVVHEEPLTNVVACYMDMAHPHSRFREILQFSIASLPLSVGLRFASATWNHDIYVCGGSRTPDALLVYKPKKNAWTQLKGLPEGREDHAMVSSDGKLYVLGGRGSSKAGLKIISEVCLYDIAADAWQPVGQLPVAVEGAPAVVLADKIYVFGGRTALGEPVGAVQQLDLMTGQSQVVGVLPEGVEGAKAIVLGKDIVLVCPDGAIYTVRESSSRSRKVTFNDDLEFEDEPLSSLEPLSLTAAEEKGKEEKEEGPTKGGDDGQEAPPDDVEVDWSLLDMDGKKQSPSSLTKRTTGEEKELSPTVSLQENVTGAAPANAPTEADEEDSRQTSTADAVEKTEEDDDQCHPSVTDNAAAEDKVEKTEDKVEKTEDKVEKTEEVDADLSEKTGSKDNEDDHESTHSSVETGPKHDEMEDEIEEQEEEDDEEEDDEEEEEEDGRSHQSQATSEFTVKKDEAEGGTCDVIITKVATMEKRRDFGLFVRKADLMVVGGQSENGYFLDNILKIHISTGQVSKVNGKLAIALSGMQVECTAIHMDFLLQYFDATSCFYGE
ncbi:hypothetical protein ACOMHN_064660 [Nucella lapillus]